VGSLTRPRQAISVYLEENGRDDPVPRRRRVGRRLPSCLPLAAAAIFALPAAERTCFFTPTTAMAPEVTRVGA
jgi:hypothetical protein